MAQIKKLKDVVTGSEFYPVTHIDAIIGIEDFVPDLSAYATKEWVEEKHLVIANALVLLNNNQSWQNE